MPLSGAMPPTQVKQTRQLRVGSGAKPTSSCGQPGGDEPAALGGGAAARVVVEPFDLLSKLPRNKGSANPDKWLKQLTDPKWQERKASCGWAGRVRGGWCSPTPILKLPWSRPFAPPFA